MNIKQEIRPCGANIPANPNAQSVVKGNIASSAIYKKSILWNKDGTIRISFNGLGAYSYLGIQNDSIRSGPTMNLEWVDAPTKDFDMDGFSFEKYAILPSTP